MPDASPPPALRGAAAGLALARRGASAWPPMRRSLSLLAGRIPSPSSSGS